MKPRLFIGSANESKEIAYAIQAALEEHVDSTVWTQNIFGLSLYNLEALLEALSKSEFGLFVFAPTDITSVRGNEHQSVRDNVVFELGLFVGRLGIRRSFIVLPRDEPLHLPSDLAGITYATYASRRAKENLDAALAPAVRQVVNSITELSSDSREEQLRESYDLEGESTSVHFVSKDGKFEATHKLTNRFPKISLKIYDDDEVTISGDADVHFDGEVFKVKVSGHGIAVKGRIHCSYSATLTDGSASWAGVLVATVSALSIVNGHVLSPHQSDENKTVLMHFVWRRREG